MKRMDRMNITWREFIRLAYMILSGHSNNGCLIIERSETQLLSSGGWLSQQSLSAAEGPNDLYRYTSLQSTLMAWNWFLKSAQECSSCSDRVAGEPIRDSENTQAKQFPSFILFIWAASRMCKRTSRWVCLFQTVWSRKPLTGLERWFPLTWWLTTIQHSISRGSDAFFCLFGHQVCTHSGKMPYT